MGKVIVIQGINDLATTHPRLAQEWDETRNGCPANVVFAGVLKKFFWLCERGHSYESSMSARSRLGTGCPFCANMKILPGFNDLKSKSPVLADEFDLQKNHPNTPETISPASEKKYFWICVKGHSYSTSVKSRFYLGTGCPYCANLKVAPGENDFKSSFPELAKTWDQKRNGESRPELIVSGSAKKYWWKCDNEHSYFASPASRIRGFGCSVCASKVLTQGVNDLATTNPHLASEFDLERNAPLSPSMIFSSSNKRYFWKCQLGHSWLATPNSRKTTNCPTCSNRKVLLGFNDLGTILPQLAREWDFAFNAPLTPSDITFGSHKRVGWICSDNSEHRWVNSPQARSRAAGCPICKNVLVLPGVNDLATTTPWLAKEWDHERNYPVTPQQVVAGTSNKYWWRCQSDETHHWRTSGDSRLAGRACPSCAKAGYDPNASGIFYFIENTELRARKVGITNSDRRGDRLAHFRKDGWKAVLTVESVNGHDIQTLETQMLRWIRKECGLPQFLDKQDMGRTGGHSETFSQDGISNQEVINKILEIKTGFHPK